jgi:hypothetical protein
VWTMTLHTTIDDAYDTLSKRLLAKLFEEEGGSMFDELLPKPKCDAAVEHIITLTKEELGQNGDTQIVEAIRPEILQMCESGKLDVNCVLASSTLQETERCELE